MPQIGARSQVEGLLPPTREDLADEAISFSDFRARIFERLRLLLRERTFLGRALLAGLVAGCLLAFLIPARYESSAQLMPPDNQGGSGLALLAAMSNRASGGSGGGGGGAMGAVAGDLLGLKSSGALFIGILNSRTVEDRLIDRFQLKKVYSLKLDDEARKQLAANTAVSEDRKSGIISIVVTDKDPRRAAAITQGYVEELNQLSAELSTSAAHRERVFLEGRLRAVKQDLDDASEKFSQFSSKNTTIDIKEQAKAMVEGASVLQGQVIAAESELRGLEEIYTPSNVRVKAVAARIAELRKQLEKLSGKGYGDPGQTSDESHDLYPSIRQLPLLGVTYADLYRRTRIQEIVYETLTQQYELAKVQEAKELPSVKVLDAAKVPERKSFPPRLLITLGVATLFAVAAALMVFARSKWDNTDENDPGKLFAQEVLVTVSARAQRLPGNGSNGNAKATIWSRMRQRRARMPGSDF